MPPCPRCAGVEVKQDSRAGETQRSRCRAGCRTYLGRTGTPFADHRWPQEVSVTAVRWSCAFRRSAAQVRALRAARGVAGAARTVRHGVQQVAPRLAQAGRRAAVRPGRRWWGDETSGRVGGQGAYRYRALAEAGPVVDGRLRPHRDFACAQACCIVARHRRRATPDEVGTDQHPADGRAGRAEAPQAVPTRSGRQRASGPDTTPLERSPGPIKDRRRPRRGRPSIRTGQRVIAGVALARAVRRGHVAAPGARPPGAAGQHVRARAAATTVLWLAAGRRFAA